MHRSFIKARLSNGGRASIPTNVIVGHGVDRRAAQQLKQSLTNYNTKLNVESTTPLCDFDTAMLHNHIKRDLVYEPRAE